MSLYKTFNEIACRHHNSQVRTINDTVMILRKTRSKAAISQHKAIAESLLITITITLIRLLV